MKQRRTRTAPAPAPLPVRKRAQPPTGNGLRPGRVIQDTVLFNANPCPMFVCSAKDLRLLQVNPAMVKQYGWSRAQLLRMRAPDLCSPQEVRKFRRMLTAGGRLPRGASREWRHRRKDGSSFDAEITCNSVSHGSLTARLVLVNDITRRKQAELKLRLSGERYRSLFEKNLDGVFMLDAQGQFLDANPAACRMSGFSVKELRQRMFVDLCAPDSLEKTIDAFRRGLAGKPKDIETAMIRRDGERVELIVTGVPVLVGGQITGIFGIARDITLQKRAEEALRENEARLRKANKERERHLVELRAVLDHLTEGLVISDVEGRVLHWNPAAVKIHGFGNARRWREPLPALPKHFEVSTAEGEVLPLDQWPLLRILKGEVLRGCELHVRRRDNRWQRELSYGGALARDKDGKPILAVVTVTDISKRKAAEAELRERSRRLAFLSKTAGTLLSSPDPVGCLGEILKGLSTLLDLDVCLMYTVVPDGTHLRLAACHGVPEEVVPRLQRLEFGQAVCGAVAASGAPAVVSNVQCSTQKRTSLIRPLGITCYVCHPLIAPERLLGTLSFGSRRRTRLDLEAVALVRTVCNQVATALQRKQAERALQRERTLLRTLIDHLPDHVYVKDVNRQFLTANAATARVMGAASPRELIGRTDADFYPPRQAGEYRADEERIVRTGKPLVDKDEPHVDPAGKQLRLLTTKLPLHDSDGHIIGLVGFCRDLTEQSRAMEALRVSEERLDQSVRLARLGHFDHDHRTNEIYYSPIMREIWGWGQEEILTLEKTIAAVHPDDRGAFVAAVRRAHDPAGDGLFVSEHRVVRQDGSIRWVSARSQTTFEGSGRKRRPVRTVGALIDITAPKQAESALADLNVTLEEQVSARTRALQESEERFRELAASIDEVFWLTSPDKNTMLYISPAYERIWGRSCASLYESPSDWLKAIHPEDRARVSEAARTKQVRGAYDEEYRIVLPDGTVKWIRDRAFTVRDAVGQVCRIAGVALDITTRKRAEEALRQSEERFRAIVHTAADGILMLDEHGRIESLNPAALKMFGHLEDDLIGHDVGRVLDAPQGAKGASFLSRFLQAGTDHGLGPTCEISGRRKDGTAIALELILAEFARGRRQGFVAMVHDITERKRLERELLEVGERERQQVGHELHDDLGQILHGVQFLVTGLRARLERKGVVEAAQLDRVTRYLNEALDTTRSLARGLQPVPPVPEGLMNALSEHAARVRKLYGVTCRFSCSKPVIVGDTKVATHLFRIAQEAVSNAVKHSRCTRILIRLKAANRRVVLGIRDNGHGRFPTPARRRGMGLHVMQFRAAAINGSLAVRRQSGRGTDVVCTVTVDAKDRPPRKKSPARKVI